MSVISVRDVSKFYGDVLGVNRVDLELDGGVVGLVGPNGSGKSTLMNLLAGLSRPTRGTVEIMGCTPSQPETYYRLVGYCTQYDSFPYGFTGEDLVRAKLSAEGYARSDIDAMTRRALEWVDLAAVGRRPIDGYSKGMRQRIKLAQSLCHEPRVIILDEPLNGLDPMARAEIITLFRERAEAGSLLLISSHILHEVDLIADEVVFLDNGYVVAEGEAAGIQGETGEPLHIFVRSDEAPAIAGALFALTHVVEVRLHQDRSGLFVKTADADRFYLDFNALVTNAGWAIDAIGPADETVAAVYRHLIVEERAVS